ncbi:hypothetical protein CAL7102_08844 [Dulcicalothrix desertica PCC 7102]|nr:hypothetical protein CAL7102_08844 [Dulcicalothrix desertica PCC 7102]
MECISPKLNFSFTNVIVLFETGGCKMLADVEGDLKITLGEKFFFDEEYILLLELAITLIKWINKIESGEIVDFYYESMDYEDEPILAFKVNTDSTWHLFSVWQNFNDSSHIFLEELIQSTKAFITHLAAHLTTNLNIDISNINVESHRFVGWVETHKNL